MRRRGKLGGDLGGLTVEGDRRPHPFVDRRKCLQAVEFSLALALILWAICSLLIPLLLGAWEHRPDFLTF